MTRRSPCWRRSAGFLGLLATVSVTPLAAQAQQAAPFPVAPGTRVRVTASNLVAPLVANFLQMRGDTAVFIEDAAGRGIWSIEVTDIRKIERSDGERKVNRPYIIRGALIGGGGGALIGLAVASSIKPSGGKKFSRGLSGGAGAAAGALIGAAIGSRFGAERWSNVPLPRRLSVVPQGRGLGLRFALDF